MMIVDYSKAVAICSNDVLVRRNITHEMIKYFMDRAIGTGSLSPCDRKKVGAVIVDSSKVGYSDAFNAVISTGFNSNPTGRCECDCSHGLTIDSTVHAEKMAIDAALVMNKDIRGAWLFVTKCPCLLCAMDIYQSGIDTVVYFSGGNTGSIRALSTLGLRCIEVISDDQDKE